MTVNPISLLLFTVIMITATSFNVFSFFLFERSGDDDDDNGEMMLMLINILKNY